MSTIRAIYAGLRAVGVAEEEDRRDLYERVTGKRSLRLMTPSDQDCVLEELRRLGFRAAPDRAAKRAPRADVRYIHVLWRLLHEAGAVEVAGKAGLNVFVRRRFGKAWGVVALDVDALTEYRHISDIISALQAWCDREGIACRRSHGDGRK